MILDDVQLDDTRNTDLVLPKQIRSACLLQMEATDTMREVLHVLQSQEKPFFLGLPPDGEAFSCPEHFAALGHLLAGNTQPPLLTLIIPPQRANDIPLANTYGIEHAASIEEALQSLARSSFPWGRQHVRLPGAPESVPCSDPITEAQWSVEMPPTWIIPPVTRTTKKHRFLLGTGLIALLLGVSAILFPLILFTPTRPVLHAAAVIPLGALSFESSHQFNPSLTQGYNDIITLSLHHIPALSPGMAYYAWLMPDQSDDAVVPLLLGTLHPGSSNLSYTSPNHTNLLASYSGVRITAQPKEPTPETPSLNPETWKWQGFIPATPAPSDENHYSLLSHLRHLLAKDPTLQANALPGGLALWLTQNVSKIEEWAGSAQGDWHGTQTSPGNADQLHRQVLRILEYLDGLFYYERDVPVGSPWIVDPLAGKIGLLDRVQKQEPPAFLTHVDIHLTGLANSPGHTAQQQQLAALIDTVISRMTLDLQRVRKDAALLVTMNTSQLRQQRNQALLDDIANLTSEVKSGWFDSKTGENIGGVLWIIARLQQLAMVPLS